jgi:hypothetical protein
MVGISAAPDKLETVGIQWKALELYRRPPDLRRIVTFELDPLIRS